MVRRILLLILVAMTGGVWAQEYRAVFAGQVTDASGASVPGASIQVVQGDTNLTQSATTGSDGRFVVPQLPPGGYTVNAHAAGFRRYSRSGLVFNVGDRIDVDIRLEVGELTDSVTVTGELVAAETNQSVMGQVMDNKGVRELPLNGRQVYMLMQLSTGVIFTQKQFGATGFSGTRAWDGNGNWTMHGGLTNSNAFLLDGASVAAGGGGWNFAPLVDAVEEFKVSAAASDASLGLSGGGVVNMTMKSGANTLHGTFSEYLRNNIFDALTTQTIRAAAQEPYLMNQQHQWNDFSGLISGPIIRNKFFYSAWYEGFRERVPFPTTVTVPTMAQRDGNFSATRNGAGQMFVVFDPLSTRSQGAQFVRDAFPGNVLPRNRINPISANIVKLVPQPNIVTNAVTETNNYASSPNIGTFRYDAWYSKFDYNWNAMHRTTASVTENFGYAFRRTNGFPAGPVVAGQDPAHRNHYASTLDHVWIVRPDTVLNVRAAWERYLRYTEQREADKFDAATLGWRSPSGSAGIHFPAIAITGYAPMGISSRVYPPDNVYALTVAVSRTAGKHLLKAGTKIEEYRRNQINTGNWYGTYNFNQAFTQRDPQRTDTDSGNGFASFLLGYPASGSTDVNPQASYLNRAYGLYLQDDYKVTPRLTLNLGLRWDLQAPLSERWDRQIVGFDPNVSYALGNARARGGFVFASPDQRTAWSANYRDFQPRAGMAYQMLSRLVWRASYGVSMLPLGGTGGNITMRQTGFARTTPYVATIGGGVDSFIPGKPGTSTWDAPFPNGILQPFGSSLGPKTQVGQGVTFDDPEYIVPRVHQFHLGLDVQLPWNVVGEASYVGSRTRRLPHNQDLAAISLTDRLRGFADPNYLNAAVPNPYAGAPELAGTGLGAATVSRAQSLRNFSQFTGVTAANTSNGSQSGDMLEVRLNKRYSSGLMFIGAYTYGKILMTRGYLEPQYDTLFRTLADYDRPHHFTFTFQYDLPFGKGKRLLPGAGRVLDNVVGGWQCNLSTEYMTGTPTARPNAHNLRNPELPEGQQNYDKWFDTCTLLTNGRRANCSPADAPITWVQLKPNELRTYDDRFPNIRDHWATQINASLFKNVRFAEKWVLQFRAEAFNAFNTPIYAGPDTNLTGALFGVVTLDQTNFPRSMQFALRLSF